MMSYSAVNIEEGPARVLKCVHKTRQSGSNHFASSRTHTLTAYAHLQHIWAHASTTPFTFMLQKLVNGTSNDQIARSTFSPVSTDIHEIINNDKQRVR